MNDFFTALRSKRFGVRLAAAVDLLFPGVFHFVGYLAWRAPGWITGLTEEQADWMRGEFPEWRPK